jgi:hypothetical protein
MKQWTGRSVLELAIHFVHLEYSAMLMKLEKAEIFASSLKLN